MRYKTALKRLLPRSLVEATRPLRLYFEPQHRFDRRFGVETTGYIEPEDLGAPEASAEETGGYEPTPRAAFRRIIKNLGLEYERYTFVDMGSGKGAVLLYAAEFPFKEIVGVEFSPTLNRIAERNLAAYRGKKICARVKTVCMNAAAFPIPKGPAVLFFFNPFKGRSLETVSGNIERAIEDGAGDLAVVYYHTESRHPVFDEARRLKTVRRGADHTIYRARGGDQSRRSAGRSPVMDKSAIK